MGRLRGDIERGSKRGNAHTFGGIGRESDYEEYESRNTENKARLSGESWLCGRVASF